ncbi:thiamine pyrophosphate-requiring protein [Polymorphum gilvum]|uniref:Acetolactate synthase large subunit n=1 Tax=Polymorphum gilvum (strain LMG 25793 / CGMCC 1.9160 / SL003B-26A1) TaxID=991905 RepID=F2IWW4_POLGS|nr:thiamine pyrophosphate-requiring protein [Polymorphum gilvum]ADZ71541.1 Acetolactate synthase large subunit [Polymorphum gilvum SL003B-26A1]
MQKATPSPTGTAAGAGRAESASLTTGGALLARLKALGIDYIFANSGTDFPPIIEGLAEAEAKQIELPQGLVMPHEAAAMGMAHGYYLATGRTQAVMAHTNVGLANCAIGAINAATEHIPVLLFSGRTPTTEKGRLGSRTVPIGWGQEMHDQTALVREACKWDYELRFPEQVSEIVDRALAIAETTPRGPVYISLPREVLCEPCATDGIAAPASIRPARPGLDAAAFDEAARLIASARNPVIFAQRGTGGEAGFAALAEIASDWGAPVCQYWAVRLALPLDHPMAAAPDPAPLLAEADVVLVIDSLAPWSPDIHKLRPGCKVIHLGQDPLYTRFPVRNFPCDLALACDVEPGLLALRDRLAPVKDVRASDIAARRDAWAARNAASRQAVLARAEQGRSDPMTKDWVSLCLSRALEGRDAAVLSELGCPLAPMTLAHPKSWYQEPHSGGLGWSFPAALGMKLGNRDRTVVATMGDGSYIFSNPVACHQIAEALDLPILVLVVNNAEWGAVRQSVLGLYPDGHAARSNKMPLTQLAPVPDFVRVAEASRAYARRVDHGDALPQALAEALGHIDSKGTLALLDVRVRA